VDCLLADSSSRTKVASAQEFIPYIWESVVAVVPLISMQLGYLSLEFFEMAAMVFDCMDNAYRKDLDLTLYLQNWSGILLRYEHDEVRQPLETHLWRKTSLTIGSLSVAKA
jgi:hypothetical protein